MFNLLITSGCSHTYGSGMISYLHGRKYLDFGTDAFLNNLVKHPKLKKFFENVTSIETAQKRLEEISWTGVLASELNISNFYNLGIGGSGVDTQIRNCFSFIEENKSKLDLQNGLFIHRVPSLTRVEMIRTDDTTNSEDSFRFMSYNFSTPANITDDDSGLEVFLNHYDFDFYTSKHLFNLLLFKKYIESTGMIFLAIQDGFDEDTLNKQYFYKRKNIDAYNKRINKFSDDMHHLPSFPSLQKMINDIGFFTFNPHEPYGVPTSLLNAGYNEDHHYSPEGHEIFGKNLAHHLKNKYNI